MRIASIIFAGCVCLAGGLLHTTPAAADATPSPSPSRIVTKARHAHVPLGPRYGYGEQPRAGYALYSRPYRTYHTLGYESGNDIGFQSQDFNAPELHGRAPRVSARRAGYWGPACQPRPVPGPDGMPWVSPFEFNCW